MITYSAATQALPYPPGMDQQGNPITLAWQIPGVFHNNYPRMLLHVDEWIRRGLDIDIPPYPKELNRLTGEHDAKVAEPVWRILVMAAELLRIVNVPVFNPGYITSLHLEDRKNRNWRINLMAPQLDYYPATVYQKAYHQAARLFTWMAQTNRTRQTLGLFYDAVQSGFIDVVSPLVPSSQSKLPILNEAHRRKIPFRHLGNRVFQLGWGAQGRLLRSGAIDSDAALGSVLSQNKKTCAHLLRIAGLPAPKHVSPVSLQAAVKAAESLGWPVVVKPADRDRGEGVTTGITNKEDLVAACKKVAELSNQLLVEKQVPGICHRIHVAAGKVVRVTRRLPKCVTGDGRSSVAALIAEANREQQALPPWKRLKPFPDDKLAQECLQIEGLDLDSVPAAGQLAPLRPFSSIEWGGNLEDLTEVIHPDNVAAALEAAQLLRLATAGVDMISEDIRIPWHQNGAIINEVNYSPQTGQSTGTGPRHTVARTLDQYFNGNGRIPIEVFAGGSLNISPALERQASLLGEGLRCFLTTHSLTLDTDGQPLNLAEGGLFNRVMALLTRRDVDALIVVVQNDELLATGLPFDSINALELLPEPLTLSASGRFLDGSATLMDWLETIVSKA